MYPSEGKVVINNVKTAFETNGNSYNITHPFYFLIWLLRPHSSKQQTFDKIKPVPLWIKLLTLLFCVAMFVGYFWTVYCEFYKFGSTFNMSAFLMLVVDAFNHVVAMVAVLSITHGDDHLNANFFYSLRAIVDSGPLFKDLNASIPRKSVLKQIVLVILLCVMSNILEICTSTQPLLKMLGYVTYYISEFILLTTFAQMLCKFQLLIQHLKQLNEAIRNSANPFENGNKISNELKQLHVDNNNKSESVSELFKIYGKMCDLIETVNRRHGLEFVFLFCSIVVGDLVYLYAILIESQDPHGNAATTDMYVKNSAGFLYCSTLLLVLAANCASVRNEARNTGVISSDILLELERNQNTFENKVSYLKKLKVFLLQIAEKDDVHISAAGVFVIDFGIISSVITAITSYFIVLLQFKQM